MQSQEVGIIKIVSRILLIYILLLILPLQFLHQFPEKMGCKKKTTPRWGYTTQVQMKLSVPKEDTPSRSDYDYSDSAFSDNNLCECTPSVST